MFHVPELSRITPERHPLMGSDRSIGNNGAFEVPSPEPGWTLYLICSDGREDDAVGELASWEHVSVSARRAHAVRIPTWKEMCYAKRLCWDGNDTVVQFHPREADYVNHHPAVLHLWRWTKGEFPTPPRSAV